MPDRSSGSLTALTQLPPERLQLVDQTASELAAVIRDHLGSLPFVIAAEGASAPETTMLMRVMQSHLTHDPVAVAWFQPWQYDTFTHAAKALAAAMLQPLISPGNGHSTPQSFLRRLRRSLRPARPSAASEAREFLEWVDAEPWSPSMHARLGELLIRLLGDPAVPEALAMILIVDGLDRCDERARTNALRLILPLLDHPRVGAVVSLPDDRSKHNGRPPSAAALLERRLDELIVVQRCLPPESLDEFGAQARELLTGSIASQYLREIDRWADAIGELFYPGRHRLRRCINSLASELSARQFELAAIGSASERHLLAEHVAFLRLLESLFPDLLQHLQERVDGADFLVRLQLCFRNLRDAPKRFARWFEDPLFRQYVSQYRVARFFELFTAEVPVLVHLLPTRAAATQLLRLGVVRAPVRASDGQAQSNPTWLDRLAQIWRRDDGADPSPTALHDLEHELDEELTPARLGGDSLPFAEAARQLDWSDTSQREIATRLATESKALATKARNDAEIVHASLVLAGIHISAGRLEEARKEIDEARAKSSDDELEQVEILRREAALMEKRGNLPDAQSLWTQAKDRAIAARLGEERLRSVIGAALANEATRAPSSAERDTVERRVTRKLNQAVLAGEIESPADSHGRRRLFVSYKHGESDCVLDDVVLLHDSAKLRIVSDRNLPAGQLWRAELFSYLLEADAILILASSKYFDSDVCQWELQTALARAGATPRFPIFWLNLDGRANHPELLARQALGDIREPFVGPLGHLPNALKDALTSIVAALSPSQSSEPSAAADSQPR